MTPAYLSDKTIAELFGRSYKWFRKTRAELERRGFPRKDALIGLTLAADVQAWLDRQRVLADRGIAERPADTTTKERLHAL